MSTFHDLEKEQRRALIEFLRQCTVPLVAEVSGTANIVGTGTLFDFGDGPLLITAAHVLKGTNYNVRDLAMPDTPNGTALITFGSFDLRREVTHDIAILQFKHGDTVRRATENWRVLSAGDIELSLSSSLIAIAGCPCEMATPRNRMLHAGWITMFVERYTPKAEDEELAQDFGLAQDLDFLTKYPDTVFRHDGSSTVAPKSVEGLSGGSVWQMTDSFSGFWTPQKALRVVGLQVSAMPGRYERARSWKTVSAVYYNGKTPRA